MKKEISAQKEYELKLKKRILKDLVLRQERENKFDDYNRKIMDMQKEFGFLFDIVDKKISEVEEVIKQLIKDTSSENEKQNLINVKEYLNSVINKVDMNKATYFLEHLKEEEAHLVPNYDKLLEMKELEAQRQKYSLLLCDSSHLLSLVDNTYHCSICHHEPKDYHNIDKTDRLIINFNANTENIFKRETVLIRSYKLNNIPNYRNVTFYNYEFITTVNQNLLDGKDVYQINRVLNKKFRVKLFDLNKR